MFYNTNYEIKKYDKDVGKPIIKVLICYLSNFKDSYGEIETKRINKRDTILNIKQFLFVVFQTEIAKRLNAICAQVIPFLSQEASILYDD